MNKKKQIITKASTITGSGLLTMLLSHICTNDPAATVASLGMGTVFSIEAGKLLVALAPNFITEWVNQLYNIKSFEKNDDLESALKEAYVNTALQIEKELFAEKDLLEGPFERVRTFLLDSISDKAILRSMIQEYFFKKLADYFENPDKLTSFIANHKQLDLANYVKQAFSDASLTEHLSVNLNEEITNEGLIDFFSTRFIEIYPLAFTQELKKNSRAKTEYFKGLLELTIKMIAALQSDVSVIKNQTATINEHLNNLSDGSNELTKLLLQQGQITSTLNLLQVMATRSGNDLRTIIEGINVQNERLERLLNLTPAIADIFEKINSLQRQMEMSNCWVPNLTLATQAVNFDKSNLFEYTTEYTPFTGRTDEFSYLFDFIDSEDPFSWLMLQGSGGMGKSRLALEFCFKAREHGFFAGFYNLQLSSLPDNNKPAGDLLPLLIIVDYAAADMQKTIDLIEYFQFKAATSVRYGMKVNKVRILLLDRKFNDDWNNLAVKIKNTHFNQRFKPFSLQVNGEDIRWTIIEHIIRRQSNGEHQDLILKYALQRKKSILLKLSYIDPQRRPLFALFAGEALVYDESSDFMNWNVNNLLTFHLNRLKRLRAKVKNYEHLEYYIERILLINTLTRQLNSEELNSLVITFNELDGQARQQLKKTYIDICEPKSTQEGIRYSGLQPDILAGQFIINCLNEYLADDANAVNETLALAWKTAPEQICWTITLLLEDQFEKDQLQTTLETIITGYTPELINSKTKNSYALLLRNLIYFYTEMRPAPDGKADGYFGLLQNLANDNPGNALIKLELEQSFVNITATTKNVIQLSSYVEKFRQFIEEREPDKLSSSFYVMSLVNLSIRLSSPEELMPYKKEVEKFYRLFPDLDIIQDALGKMLTLMCGRQSDDENEKSLTELKTLHKHHPKNISVAASLANSLYNLTHHHKEPRLSVTQSELRTLADLFSNSSKVVFHYVKSLYNQNIRTEVEENRNKISEELLTIFHKHRTSIEIGELVSRALYNNMLKANSQEKRLYWLSKIDLVCIQSVQVPGILEAGAKGNVIILQYCITQEEITGHIASVNYYYKITGMDEGIGEILSNGIYLAVIHPKSENLEFRLFDILIKIRKKYPRNQNIAISTAGFFVHLYKNTNDGSISSQLLNEVSSLYNEDPHPRIAEHLADAYYHKILKSENSDSFRPTLAYLINLAETYHGNIDSVLMKTYFHIVSNISLNGNIHYAEEFVKTCKSINNKNLFPFTIIGITNYMITVESIQNKSWAINKIWEIFKFAGNDKDLLPEILNSINYCYYSGDPELIQIADRIADNIQNLYPDTIKKTDKLNPPDE